MQKYIEIYEEIDSLSGEVPQMLRINVSDDAEAESIYNDNKNDFAKHKARVVEAEHGGSAKDSKPCKTYEIKNGKVLR